MRDIEWYERPSFSSPPVVPAVKLNGTFLVMCPFCNEVHMHTTAGIRAAKCGGPRAQYEIRGLAPTSYVRLLDPSDPPEEDWSLLDRLETAATVLAERLRHEPGLSRAVAELHCKLETGVPGIFFRSFVWPPARRLAGLAQCKRGRPQGSRTQKSAPD